MIPAMASKRQADHRTAVLGSSTVPNAVGASPSDIAISIKLGSKFLYRSLIMQRPIQLNTERIVFVPDLFVYDSVDLIHESTPNKVIWPFFRPLTWAELRSFPELATAAKNAAGFTDVAVVDPFWRTLSNRCLVNQRTFQLNTERIDFILHLFVNHNVGLVHESTPNVMNGATSMAAIET